MNVNKLIKNVGGEQETMVAMCKLFAHILYPIAKKSNATNITFKVNDITYKETNEKIGNIKVLYTIEESTNDN